MINILRTIRWFLISPESTPQRARRLLKILVLLGLFLALFWIVPMDKVIRALFAVDLKLFFLGVSLGLLAVLLTAIQMKPLLDNQKIQRSIGQIFAVNLAVKFYLLFTPTTIIASGVRLYRFSNPEGKYIEAFVALMYFRLFKTFLTLAIGLGFLAISAQGALRFNLVWIVLLILGIIVLWLLITRFSFPAHQWMDLRSGKLFNSKFLDWVLQKIEKLLEAALAYAHMPATGLLVTITSGILSYLAVIASTLMFAKSLGIDISFLEMGWIQAATSLVSQLPFTMAEGLGVREVTLVALLGTFNISSELALAMSFLIFIQGVLIAIMGGAVEAARILREKQLPKLGSNPGKTNEL